MTNKSAIRHSAKQSSGTEIPPLLRLLDETNQVKQAQSVHTAEAAESSGGELNSPEVVDSINSTNSADGANESSETNKPKKERLTTRRPSIKPTTDLFGQLMRQMLTVADYTFARVESFPKRHKLFVGLGNTIIDGVNKCLLITHTVCSYNNKIDKEDELRKMSVHLKALEDYVSIACQLHCISLTNREAWLRILTDLDNTVIGMAMWIEQRKKELRQTKRRTFTKDEVSLDAAIACQTGRSFEPR